MGNEPERTMFDFQSLLKRWPVSLDFLRLRAKSGELKTLYFGGRRFVPLAEVLRVESVGFKAGRRGMKVAQ